VCVCKRQRERERSRDSEGQRDSERQRKKERVCERQAFSKVSSLANFAGLFPQKRVSFHKRTSGSFAERDL